MVAEAAEPETVYADPGSWKDIAEVDDTKVPEVARPYVAKMRELYAGAESRLTERVSADTAAAKAGFEESRSTFLNLIDHIEKGGDTAIRGVVTAMQAATAENHRLASDAVEVLWAGFSARNPEYAQAPPGVRDQFAGMLTSGQFETFPGKNRLEKIEAAYGFAKYTNKWGGVAPAAPAVAAAPTANPAAKKQALVSTGARTVPATTAVEKSMAEIEAEAMHLLG